MAKRRELNAPPRPLEDRLPERKFERLNAPRQGRLGEVQHFRCFAKGAGVCKRHEMPQLDKTHHGEAFERGVL